VHDALRAALKGRLSADAALTCRVLLATAEGSSIREIVTAQRVAARRASRVLSTAATFFETEARTSPSAAELVRSTLTLPTPRGGRRPVSGPIEESIRALGSIDGQQRMSLRSIAAKTGVHHATVSRVLRRPARRT